MMVVVEAVVIIVVAVAAAASANEGVASSMHIQVFFSLESSCEECTHVTDHGAQGVD